MPTNRDPRICRDATRDALGRTGRDDRTFSATADQAILITSASRLNHPENIRGERGRP